jgi:hypothetical protein
MAFRRQRVPVVTPPAHTSPAQGLVAAAARVNLEGKGWRTYKFGDDSWQQEAWRLYDIIGELRFVANWIGSACSKVRIFVAEVDKNGRIQQETDKPKVAALADTLFGGPPAKAEALRTLGINLVIAGDAFVVGRGAKDPDSDEWHVVSCSELKRWGSQFWLLNPNEEKEKLDPENDLVIRVWTPHPRRYLWADSPTRAAMPILYEIERLTRYVFAQIDSRLVSAGLLFIPKEVSFPDEQAETEGADALTEVLLRTGSASLRGEGTAAGVLPTIAELPIEALGKVQLLQFTSELSQQARELRDEALRRFAIAMDIDPSIMTGVGDANHWGAWQIVEGQIKIHIEPLMTRICDALTTAYLMPALKTLKEKEDRYVFWYDTAPLTVRPQRLKETQELQAAGIVSRETVRISGDYKSSDAPSDEEDLQIFTRELMLRDPALFQNPAVRKVAGYTEDILPAETVIAPSQPGGAGAGPPPPPPPPTGIAPAQAGTSPPEVTEAQNAPGGPPAVEPPSGVTASATVPSPYNTFIVANATVLRALELAGKRLVSRNGQRNHWPDTPAYALHTKVRVGNSEQAEKLLAGAWDHFAALSDQIGLVVDKEKLQDSIQDYCVTLLVREQAHNVNVLGETLRRQGFLDGIT